MKLLIILKLLVLLALPMSHCHCHDGFPGSPDYEECPTCPPEK